MADSDFELARRAGEQHEARLKDIEFGVHRADAKATEALNDIAEQHRESSNAFEALRAEIKLLRSDMSKSSIDIESKLSAQGISITSILVQLEHTSGEQKELTEKLEVMEAWRLGHERELGPIAAQAKIGLVQLEELRVWAVAKQRTEADGIAIRRWWKRMTTQTWKVFAAVLAAAVTGTALWSGIQKLIDSANW